MAETIKLAPEALKPLRTVDERLMSYNVEMAEVTGGTFWKEYTPGQIDGTETFPPIKNLVEDMRNLMQVYPPIDLYDEKLRELTRQLGPAWVRVSGTWATKTYYDFDGTGVTPPGYQNRLTKEQWIGVLDFCKAVGAKLLISVANCNGLHKAEEPWNPSEAEKIFSLSRDYGVPIDAAEFMNEPNMLGPSGGPDGYTVEQFARDQDAFFAWVRANYPECLCVGPCNTGNTGMGPQDDSVVGRGMGDLLGNVASCEDLMAGTKEKLDVYSYHYYNGCSERLASLIPASHWDVSRATDEDYLDVAARCVRDNLAARDRFCPGGQTWVTESGDAGGGGGTWASTYLDVFRTLNELAEFATLTDGVIFHNTLASSDYGFLAREVFDPRPNYFAVLLWNRLMGQTVYDSGEPLRKGARVFCHSRKDGQAGKVYMILNNSTTDPTTVELPVDAVRYTLSADSLRAPVMKLNGRELTLTGETGLPDLSGEAQPAGTLTLAPATITFLVV